MHHSFLLEGSVHSPVSAGDTQLLNSTVPSQVGLNSSVQCAGVGHQRIGTLFECSVTAAFLANETLSSVSHY